MLFNYLLYSCVILCWVITLFFLARFALAWHRSEPEKLRAWLAIAALAALALGVTVLLPGRGGYDNNHDFTYLGLKFFTKDPFLLVMFKEMSPLFTDGITDFFSGNSIWAVLWKNRLLPTLSIFVFFTGLRRLGASAAVSAGAAAFLFLNFLSPLNASTFSTTPSNMLIWLISLLAIFDAYAAPDPGPGALAWIISSLVLVISARIEFLPANLLLIAAFAAAKIKKGSGDLFKSGNLAVAAAGACAAGAWTFHALSFRPANQIVGQLTPLHNLAYQLGARNLAVITGLIPKWQDLHIRIYDTSMLTPFALVCWLFLLAAIAGVLAGCRADRGEARPRLAALAVILLWLGYFSYIFKPLDTYPLHFMRHQLYFLVPCAYLFALGLDGLERAAAGAPRVTRRLLGAFCALALAVYAAFNAKAALGFNNELRTNDRELDFLMKAQRDWPAGCVAVHPPRNRQNSRADFIHKYFPAMPDCRESKGSCLLKYVSPEPLIFTDSGTDPLEQAPLTVGRPGDAWRAISFHHAFYTLFNGKFAETTEPVPLTIGFFKMQETGRDRAFMETMAGACAFGSGDLSGAALKFKRAVEEEPSCLNCRYLLAVSYAAENKKEAALAELAKVGKIGHVRLSPERHALVEKLARGETEEAAGLASRLCNEHPELFFKKDFARSIRDAGQRSSAWRQAAKATGQ